MCIVLCARILFKQKLGLQEIYNDEDYDLIFHSFTYNFTYIPYKLNSHLLEYQKWPENSQKGFFHFRG